MIIYFLIENFDVDHFPQCDENTETHFNMASVWSGSQSGGHDPNMYKNICRKREKSLPKGITLMTMQYPPPHSSLTMENGRKKKHETDRKVDQMNPILTSWTSASRSAFTPLKRPFFYVAHASRSRATLSLSSTPPSRTPARFWFRFHL